MSMYFRLIAGGHREIIDGQPVDFLAKKADGTRHKVKDDNSGVIQVFPDIVKSDRDLSKVFKGKFVSATEAEYEATLAILDKGDADEVSAPQGDDELEKMLNEDAGDDLGSDVTDQFDVSGVVGLKVFFKKKKYHVYLNGSLVDNGGNLKKDAVNAFIEENF